MHHHRTIISSATLAVAFSLAGAQAFAQAPQYTYQTYPGPHAVTMYFSELSSTGAVGGYYSPSGSASECIAVIDGKPSTWRVGNSRFCYVAGISSTSDVTGNAAAGGWLRTADGHTTMLHGPDNTRFTPAAMNDQDVIAGTRSAERGQIPVVWQNGHATDLPVPGAAPTLQIEAINGAGTIVGLGFDDDSGPFHAYAWVAGQLQELPPVYPLGGGGAVANGISSTGTIAGNTDVAPGSDGVLRTHACLWRDGQVVDLGVPAGTTDSSAQGVNASGDAVGLSYDDTNSTRGVLWRSGVPSTGVLLDTLVALPAGWIITEARRINDAGQILVTAESGGQEFQLLLTPIPH